MAKVTTLKVPKYALVRRTSERWEENMIAGDTDEKGVKVYKYASGSPLTYQFFKRFKPEELRVVGIFQSLKEFLPKLVG